MTRTIKIKNSKKPYDFIVIDEEKFDPQIHERFFSFDEINADLQPEYRKIIEYVWDHYLSKDEWILEQVLFHPNGPLAKSGLKQSDLQNLSGLIYQFDDSGKSKYRVTFPAVFFSDRGNECEGIIYAYIRHLQERYQKDPYIESVSSQNLVSGNIISESWAHKLGQLIQLGGFLYGGSFSIGSEGWSAGFPSKLIVESYEHTDLKEYIRSLVMDRYDPNSPVFEKDRWAKKKQLNKIFNGEYISEKEFYSNSKILNIKSFHNSEDKIMPDSRKVFVVHGRDSRLRDDFFSFLRALGLQPIEWSEALKLTGKATPYIGEALESAFKTAQAVIVLLTPDDEVRLSPELWKDKEDENEKEIRLQARPNVLFEAGMAFGRYSHRTLLVEVGQVKAFSDVAGRHVVRLSNSPDKRNEIAERLRTAECDVSTSGNDWLNTGNFEVIREQKTASIPDAHIPNGHQEISHETLVLSKLIHPGLPTLDHNNCVITGRLFNKSKQKVVVDRVQAYDRNNKPLNITWSNRIDPYGNPEKTYELIGFVDSEDIFVRQDNGEEIEYCKLEIFHSLSQEPLTGVFDEYEDWIDQQSPAPDC